MDLTGVDDAVQPVDPERELGDAAPVQAMIEAVHPERGHFHE
jgi:hypothetical protein